MTFAWPHSLLYVSVPTVALSAQRRDVAVAQQVGLTVVRVIGGQKMKRAILAVILLAPCSGAMAYNLAASCALMNRVNADGGIRLTSDVRVALGLCLVTK